MLELLLAIASLGVSPGSPALHLEESDRRTAEEIPSGLVLEPLRSPAGPRSAQPSLTRGADGELYLCWFERVGERGGVVRFSVLGKNGWGRPLVVVKGRDLRPNWADFPAVHALESGVLVANWLRSDGSRHGYRVEFALSSDRGRHWTAPQVLHSSRSSAEYGFVSIVPIDGKTFGAIWLDGRNTARKDRGAKEMGLYFRTISAAGKLGRETVLDPRVCDCCQTDLTVTPDGGLLAIYRDRSSDEVRDISFVRFNGKTWSKPGLVHKDGWLIAGCPVNGPRVASEAGTTAAAWFTGVGRGGGNVLAAFLGTAKAGFGFPIDVDDGRPVGRVDVVSTGDGSALVSWMEYAGKRGAEWRVRRLWKDGRKANSIAVGRVPFNQESGYLRMVRAGSGAVLAWTNAGPERRVATARIRVGK